jgi:predicted dehydrogenase
MSGRTPVRLGLVGAGRWGRVYLRVLAGIEGALLLRLASRNGDSAALAPPGCTVSADWRALVAAGDLDGLIIATPPATHAEIAEAAMRAGIGVLVEKPLTLDVTQAVALRRVAAQCRVPAMVDHIHLFSPAFRELKRQARLNGPVVAVTGRAGNWGPYRTDTPVLWDWGAHDVAMVLDLMGAAPDRIEARQAMVRPMEGETGEIVHLSLGFGPVAAELEFGTLMDKTRRFTVTCAGATLVYDDLAAAKLTRDGEPVAIAATPPLTVAVGDFIRALSEGDADLSGLDLGVRVVEVLAACGYPAPSPPL